MTEYVTFSNNIVRNAGNGFVINAADRPDQSKPLPIAANSIRIQNVLLTDIGSPEWGGGGKLLRIFGGVSNVEVSHITSLGNPNGILDPHDPADVNPNLTFRYNIVERKLYGIGAGGDEGITTISRNFTPFVYNQNVLVNTSSSTRQAISDGALKSRYPAVTLVASGWNAVRDQRRLPALVGEPSITALEETERFRSGHGRPRRGAGGSEQRGVRPGHPASALTSVRVEPPTVLPIGGRHRHITLRRTTGRRR